MHRLFVALRPPPAVRAHLAGLQTGLPGARWQEDAQLHCTLRFIGEVDRHQGADIAAALAGIRHPPVTVRLGAVGSFDRTGRVESLWVGLVPRDPLKTLHDKVERALLMAGIPPEHRAYHPHITIARFARRSAPPCGVEAMLPPPAPLPVCFETLHLYESILGSEGALYTVVESVPLSQ